MGKTLNFTDWSILARGIMCPARSRKNRSRCADQKTPYRRRTGTGRNPLSAWLRRNGMGKEKRGEKGGGGRGRGEFLGPKHFRRGATLEFLQCEGKKKFLGLVGEERR